MEINEAVPIAEEMTKDLPTYCSTEGGCAQCKLRVEVLTTLTTSAKAIESAGELLPEKNTKVQDIHNHGYWEIKGFNEYHDLAQPVVARLVANEKESHQIIHVLKEAVFKESGQKRLLQSQLSTMKQRASEGEILTILLKHYHSPTRKQAKLISHSILSGGEEKKCK